MEEEHTAACRLSVVRCWGLPRSDHRTGHSGELLEARAALGTVGVLVGDALSLKSLEVNLCNLRH